MADYSQLMNLEKKAREQAAAAPNYVPERPNGEKSVRSLPPTQQSQQKETHIPERANARTMERSNGRRIITRNSFEIYEDQMDSLRQLAYAEKMQGKLGSMSAMVREAIDTYILNKTPKK